MSDFHALLDADLIRRIQERISFVMRARIAYEHAERMLELAEEFAQSGERESAYQQLRAVSVTLGLKGLSLHPVSHDEH